ncbi:MAG: hypothetical protein AVDCRST_MAG61-3018 [uncultured Friedmanniella sp.]|uniref:DUF3515 domain-containing protein n=1 Tax=uncultured Friedmanniella sp. TaxID=335381 RepID=A0A6J4LI02_9ACTN|nr:DUF3515 domain-containing protein [uncultured Friedmanniella sp.]CAA9333188.1 MAG: hypothetical protein AVDCRST_MAG61-3018 [uncultured Friedmanniella sp.]
MSRKPGRWRRLAAGLAGGLALVGCVGPVQVAEPDPEPAARAVCDQVLAALPEQVLESTRRPTEPGVLSRAWGDPPITLTCGVPAPPGLTASSECLEVNGVGWFAEPAEGGTLFTTIGRAVFVEVGVPQDYEPQVDVLVDLAAAVGTHNPVEQPCR